MCQTNWSMKIIKRVSVVPRAVVFGVIVAILSFFGVDWVSGGFFTTSHDIQKIAVAVFLRCENFPKDQTKRFYAEVLLQKHSNIVVTISAFGDEFRSGSIRKKLISSCESMSLRTNFKPLKIIKFGPEEVKLKTKVTEGEPGIYHINIPAKEYSRSRGGIIIHTGLKPTIESISTKALQISISAGQANVGAKLELKLPKGYIPESASPPPDHMISLDRIKLYWEGNKNFGRSAPISVGSSSQFIGKHERGRLEDIGVQLRYINPRKKKLELSLLFLFSAFFGVGFSIFGKSFFSRITSDNSNRQSDTNSSR